jgi:hypothetical protein
MRLLQLLSVLCLFLFSSQYSFSQDYSKMPAAVQQKMDQNKIEGKNSLDGVFVKYAIVFNDGASMEKQIILQGLLKSEPAIRSANKNTQTGVWELVCNASFALENLKALIDPKGFQIDKLLSQLYFI